MKIKGNLAHRRNLAAVLDMLLYWLCFFVAEFACQDETLPLLALVVNFLLFVTTGQTLSKKLLGLRVVDQDGQRCGFWVALNRSVFTGILTWFWPVGALCLALMREGRCPHDWWMGTRVISTDPTQEEADPEVLGLTPDAPEFTGGPPRILRFLPFPAMLFTIAMVVLWLEGFFPHRTHLVAAGPGLAAATIPQSGAREAVFSPDGHWLATNPNGDTVQIWEFPSLRPAKSLRHLSSVLTMAFSRNSDFLVTSSGGGSLTLWHVQRGQPILELKGARISVGCLDIGPDGSLVGGGWEMGPGPPRLRRWESKEGPELQSWAMDKSVEGVAFSADGRWLAASQCDGVSRRVATCRIALPQGQKASTLEHQGLPAFSLNRKWMACLKKNSETLVLLYDLNRMDSPRAQLTLKHIPQYEDSRPRMALSNSGDCLAVLDGEGHCTLARFHDKKWKTLQAPSGVLQCLAFSPDDKVLLTGGPEGFYLWDVATARMVGASKNLQKTPAKASGRSGSH